MTWDGKMMPCGMMTEPVAHPLEVGFDAAWDMIRQQAAGIRLPAKCAGCGHRKYCGACAAVCLAETGSFDGVPEYMCRRAEELLKQTRQVWEKRNGV